MLNILFLVNRFSGVGGIENMTTLLACLFKTELGHQTCIFSVEGQMGIEVDSSLKENDIDLSISTSTDKSVVTNNFIEYVGIMKPDVVIFQDSYAPIEYLLDYVRKPTRIFTVEHNTPDCILKNYIERWKSHKVNTIGGLLRKMLIPYVYSKILLGGRKRHKKLVGLSDKYILLSPSYKSILKKYYHIASDNIITIPNIKKDFGDNHAELSQSLFFQKKKQFLFVGRLNSQKGIDKLINVWRLLEPKVPDYELLVVGDGELRTLLEEAIDEYKLKRIKLEGFQFNMVEYYREASAIFMTSLFEGLPLVISEAMQLGVIPFVFDTFSSLHDIVEDQKNGFIIKPFEVELFANSVCYFLSMNNYDVSELRKEAIEGSKKFTKQNVLYQWNNLFER